MDGGEHNNLVTKAPYDPRAIIFLVQSLWTDFKENPERKWSRSLLREAKCPELQIWSREDHKRESHRTKSIQVMSSCHFKWGDECGEETIPFCIASDAKWTLCFQEGEWYWQQKQFFGLFSNNLVGLFSWKCNQIG